MIYVQHDLYKYQLLIGLFSLLGRHRWVEYASKDRYNASQIPPEWHGWLHFITDHTGDEVCLSKSKDPFSFFHVSVLVIIGSFFVVFVF